MEGKVELNVLVDDFGILHVTEKCLCVMFGFHLGTVMFPRTKHMMITTMLLDPFIRF